MQRSIPAWQRLLAEMKRRKVFKAVALYGTGVFALLQVADLLSPTLGLPEVFLTWLVVLGVAGFPFAVFTAWIFDLTSYGWRRTGLAGSGEVEEILALPRSQRWPPGLLALLGVVLLMLGAWWVGTRAGSGGARADDTAAAPPVASIAVLPFENIGDPADEPFSDGLAEEIGNVLARLDGVRVVARTSAFAFKGRSVDARTIGRELGVGSIVEGTVRRSGAGVRISAQLSRTSDGFRVWSETWERELTAAGVFAIQEEITRAVAGALSREVDRVAPAKVANRETSDLEAYDLYLLGQHRWTRRNADAVRAAITNYEQAIARDSVYTLAWAGLARAWRQLPFYDHGVPSGEAYRQAVRAADRALALAPDMAEANAVRGIIAAEYEVDLVKSSRLLARAIAIRPSYAEAYDWLCEALVIGGHDADALPACEKAVELNPLGSVPNLLLSLPLAGLGRTHEALAQVERAVALDPDVALAHFIRADLLVRLGRRAEAAESLERLGRSEGASNPSSLRLVAAAYPGDPPAAGAIDAVRALERESGEGLYHLAALYAWAGAPEDAIRVIESAIAARSPWLGIVAVSSAYDVLRTDLRFQKVLGGMGLPNGNTAYRRRHEAGTTG